MLTRERLLTDLDVSQRLEEATYTALTQELYKGLQEPLKVLYGQMAAATNHLTLLTAQTLVDHPRVIKILRYCLAPVVSQMRLGQIIGVTSTGPFEQAGLATTLDQAEALVGWFRRFLDFDRFPWADSPRPAPPFPMPSFASRNTTLNSARWP